MTLLYFVHTDGYFILPVIFRRGNYALNPAAVKEKLFREKKVL
jgi:hypothetical protein